MARLKNLRAFTLIETLVAGILISIVSGAALMIYLNISGSLAKTQDIIIRQQARMELDSLSLISGAFELTYTAGNQLMVIGKKENYQDMESVFLVSVVLEDANGKPLEEQKKLIYEPK